MAYEGSPWGSPRFKREIGLVSTLYHGLAGPAKRVFQVLDRQAIYLLIAGTHTPFTLVALKGASGWWMFCAIWALAVVGIVLDALPPEGFRWLLAGGIFYTSGILTLHP